MAKIIPVAADAPPQTAATLREITDRIYGLENFNTYAQSSQSATDKGQAATFQALSRQVNDLVGRISYSNAAVGTGYVTSSSQSLFGYGASLTFTLTEPRVVSVTSYIGAQVGVTITGAFSSAGSTANGQILLNGSPISTASSIVTGTATVTFANNSGTGTNTSLNQTQTLNTRYLATLGAGTYTVQGGVGISISVGGSATGFCWLYNSSIYVDVMQRP